MSAEDYEDVPGMGGGGGYGRSSRSFAPRAYTCYLCQKPIEFTNRKPVNKDGTPHRCKATNALAQGEKPDTPEQAVLFAMAAMNAIISGSIQSAGVDHIHQMNFYDVADASWRVAAAMVSQEKSFRFEYEVGA